MYTQKYRDTFEMDAINIVDLSSIKNAGITAVNPGKASIVATYRSPETDANGMIPDEGAYRYSQSKDIYVPLDLKTYVDSIQNKIYHYTLLSLLIVCYQQF